MFSALYRKNCLSDILYVFNILSVLLAIIGGMPYQSEVSNHQAGIEYCLISLCFKAFVVSSCVYSHRVALDIALSWMRLFCHDVLCGFVLSGLFSNVSVQKTISFHNGGGAGEPTSPA